MQLNNVSFTGKKEVIYGLTKATKEAKEAQINQLLSMGPNALESKSLNSKNNIAAMNAYVDMVVNDSSFKETIENIAPGKETREMRQNLKCFNSYLILKNAIINKAKKSLKDFQNIQFDKLWNVFLK